MDGKGALWKVATLAKIAEMTINRQKRQTVNKNSNEMAKGPFTGRNNVFPYFVNSTETGSCLYPSRFRPAETW